MNERLLMDFLAQRINAVMLNEPPPASMAADAGEFDLFPCHLLQLCDAVLGGDLDPAHMLPISRCLYYSGKFRWSQAHPDGRVVEEILSCWLTFDEHRVPGYREIHFCRQWLLLGRPPESGQFD